MQVSFRPLNQHILVLLLVVSIPATNLFSQITSSTGYTADEIASYLAGDGVIIDNAVMDCHNLAFGKFDCVDCNVGIDSGVILTSVV